MTELARKALIALASLLVLAPQPALADIQYFYDETGRLVQVVDHSGESAQYVYDAAGNIVQIIRVSAGTVSVAGFTPKSGPVGTAVTIYGAGFSSTPASNTVQFNGTAASVTSASANQLVATVPAGATSGTISVTVGAQTGTSAESFTVTSSAVNAPPTISGFTPAGGAPGTAVTITGTSFDPVLINNTVRFNATQASISGLSATQIGTTVPTYAASGRISVRTPYGTAVSANDFIIPPSGYSYADIIAQARVAIDGAPGSLAIGTANKHGIVVFDGTQGDYLTLVVSSLAVSPSGSVPYKLFDPSNAQVATGSVSTSAPTIHLPRLARTGSYSIIFSPGAATASLSFALKRDPALSASQPTANLSITVPGQTARVLFQGAAGSAATVRLAISSTTPANETATLQTWRPDGTQLHTTTGTQSSDGAVTQVASLPATGTYATYVIPWNSATGTMSVTLNPAANVEIDASALSVSNSAAGYQKRYFLNATAGQTLAVALTGLAYTPTSSSSTTVTVYKPDGAQLLSDGNCSFPGGNCQQLLSGSLPMTGKYMVVLTPPSSVSFTGTLTLSSLITGALTSGTAANLSFTRPGHSALYTLSGTAGQAVTLRLTISGTTPANQTTTLQVFKPDGTVLHTNTGSQSTDGAVTHVASLPSTGTYKVYVVPWLSATGTMALTLNPAMDLVVDADSSTIATTTAGYTKRFLFNATAGQRVGVGTRDHVHTPSSGSSTGLVLYGPSGNAINSMNCTTSGLARCELNMWGNPAGPFTIAVTPPAGVNFSGTVTLSTFATGTISVSGGAVGVSLARDGQDGWYTFSGTSGQLLRLSITGMSTTPSGQTVTFQIWRPNGTSLGYTTPWQASHDWDVPALPETGTYTVYISPWWGSRATLNMALNPR
jgi:YD repeat-containing protein